MQYIIITTNFLGECIVFPGCILAYDPVQNICTCFHTWQVQEQLQGASKKIMKVIKWSKARKIHSGDLFYNTLRAHNKLAWMKSFFLESFHEWTNDCVCWKMTILSDTKSKTGIWVSCLQVCWRNSVYRYYIVWSWHALVHYCGTKQTFPVSHQHSHHRAMSPFICGILFSCMNALFLTTSF